MRVAVYGTSLTDGNIPFVRRIFEKFKSESAALMIYAPFREFLEAKGVEVENAAPFSAHSEWKKKSDVLFSIGGDGTLLNTLSLVRDSGIPIAGINTGRLGFLSGIAREEAEKAIKEICRGRFTLDRRTLLRLEAATPIFGEMNYALNEITLHKQDTASMIVIHVTMNGEFLNSYWCDGLVIATPTGSTAYSLSCGGPIITPDSPNIILSPVAPHNLNVRPFVIPDTNTLQLRVEGRGERFLVSLDSRSETIDSSAELTIRKENFTVNLLRLSGQNFLSTLRSKLMWGMDKRN